MNLWVTGYRSYELGVFNSKGRSDQICMTKEDP